MSATIAEHNTNRRRFVKALYTLSAAADPDLGSSCMRFGETHIPHRGDADLAQPCGFAIAR
jgi:hypothetical protein